MEQQNLTSPSTSEVVFLVYTGILFPDYAVLYIYLLIKGVYMMFLLWFSTLFATTPPPIVNGSTTTDYAHLARAVCTVLRRLWLCFLLF